MLSDLLRRVWQCELLPGGRESPAFMMPPSPGVESFFASEWVDNHTLVGPESGDRFSWRNRPFRLTIPAFLGATAANEDKFSKGLTTIQVLGLEFDTRLRTVSIPSAKISKVLGRKWRLQMQYHITRRELYCALGIFR